MANTDIKGVIFDYGGTIDSRGDHWSEVIWDGYREAGVQVTKEQFRDCYVYAERELAKTRHILPEHNFYDLLLIKMRIEIGNLVENAVLPSDYPVEEKALAVARYCYNRAKESVEEARQVLEFVHERVPNNQCRNGRTDMPYSSWCHRGGYLCSQGCTPHSCPCSRCPLRYLCIRNSFRGLKRTDEFCSLFSPFSQPLRSYGNKMVILKVTFNAAFGLP